MEEGEVVGKGVEREGSRRGKRVKQERHCEADRARCGNKLPGQTGKCINEKKSKPIAVALHVCVCVFVCE